MGLRVDVENHLTGVLVIGLRDGLLYFNDYLLTWPLIRTYHGSL